MEFSLKTALRVIALCAAAGGSGWVAVKTADMVERRNLAAVQADLAEAAFDWTEVEADGSLIVLSGTAPDEAERFRALTAAGSVVNPANLRDRMEVPSATALPAPEFRLEIHRRGDEATVFGLVPGAPPEAPGLDERLSATLPGLRVSNLVSASVEGPPEGWDTGVAAAFEAIDALRSVRVVLTPERLEVAGLAPDQGTADALAQSLQESLGPDMQVTLDLEVPRPVVAPFLTRFQATPAGARFDACVASTERGRARIIAAAQSAGAGEDTVCTLAIGAPSPEWDAVTADALGILATLGAGTVTVSDLTVSLVPGDEVAMDTVMRAAARLERALPEGYRLHLPEGLTDPAVGEDDPGAVFTATRSPEGVTILRGVAGAPGAEDVVESFAASRLSARDLHMSVTADAAVRDGWSVRVLAGLDAFAEIHSGRLRVTPEAVVLRGATGDPQLSERLSARLGAALGASSPFTLDVAYREALDPVAAKPTPEECLEDVRAIQAETKITFAPGATELDRDARRIVERIAAVLRECSDVQMDITGHTDSQGGAEMNRTLSEARAEAVLEALVAERVMTSSLTARGLGETEPAADNDTADGREANRRIEFRLRYPLQGPPWPPEAEDAAAADQTEDDDGTD